MAKESNTTQSADDCVYGTFKEFTFFGEKRSIILHNGNGIQSLVSICNALILKQNLVIEEDLRGEWELLLFLKENLEALCPEEMKDSLPEAVSKIQEIEEYSPKPVWNGISSFKDNNCALIFELLKIPIFHGWLITDDEPKCFEDIDVPPSSNLEETMSNKNGDVTEFGLSYLKRSIQNHQICVLVQKHKLHTAIKHEEELYLLIMEKSLNKLGWRWQKISGLMVREDFIETRHDDTSEEVEGAGGEDDSEDRMETDESETHETSTSEEEGYIGHGGQEAGSDDSENSMETHVGGYASPTTVLEDFSATDDSIETHETSTSEGNSSPSASSP